MQTRYGNLDTMAV